MSKSELTKLQRTTLEAAAVRNDLTIFPVRSRPGLNAGSTAKLVKTLIAKGLAEERLAEGKTPGWRTTDDGRRLAVVITRAGLETVGMAPAGKTGRRSREAPIAAKQAVVAAVSQAVPRRPRPGSKLAMLVELLGRKDGATIDEMSTATGWQSHSVRGVLSAVVKRKLGLKIVSEKLDARGRVYRTRDGSAMALVQGN